MELQQKRIVATLVVCMLIMLMAVRVFGVSGATIDFNSTEYGPSTTAGNMTTNRSTITTMRISLLQQNENWKGYVGNVSGAITLDDAAAQTLYDWPTSAFTGEVYATRFTGIDLGNVECGNSTAMSSENTFFNMTDSQRDSINMTFNATAHAAFDVGLTPFIADDCPSIATYVNDVAINPSSSAAFQEMLIQDTGEQLIWVARINDDTTGFDNQEYDFQMIVPESDTNSTRTTYYFYLELDS